VGETTFPIFGLMTGKNRVMSCRDVPLNMALCVECLDCVSHTSDRKFYVGFCNIMTENFPQDSNGC
jgi:hypothetical protein